MTFPEIDATLRTDASFDEMRDEEHHKGPSPFAEIQIQMVSLFPIDYMHLVCLGLMKHLLLLWMRGPLKCRLGSRIIANISEGLLSLKDNIPSEFSRKPRSLHEIDRWKAIEFRQFLLYTGPVVLLQSIHENLYRNFMVLSIAMHILLNEALCQSFSGYAHELLVVFVNHFYQIYGNDMAVYNVHALVHLAKDAIKFGSLENVSAFPFANFLGRLKRLIRKPCFALEQVIRRLSEQTGSSVGETFPILKNEHLCGPLPNIFSTGIQYRSIKSDRYKFKLNFKDSCVRVGDKVGLIRNIVSHELENYIVYVEFGRTRDFFDTPLSSSSLGIHRVSDVGTQLHVAKLSDIQSKCVLLPYKRDYIAIPYTDSVW